MGRGRCLLQEEPGIFDASKLLTPPLHGAALGIVTFGIENSTHGDAYMAVDRPFAMLTAARSLMLDVVVRSYSGCVTTSEVQRLGRPFGSC